MVYKTSKSIYLLFLLSYPAIYYKNEINIFFNKNKNKLSLFLSLLLIYCAFLQQHILFSKNYLRSNILFYGQWIQFFWSSQYKKYENIGGY